MKTQTVILAAVLAGAALAGCNRPDGSGPTPKTAMNMSSEPAAGSALSANPGTLASPAPDPAGNTGLNTGRDTANLPDQAPADTANSPNSPPNPQSPVQPPDQPQVSNPRDAKNYAG